MFGKIIIVMLSGMMLSACIANLRSNKLFADFQQPSKGKSMVYLIRDENIMATKFPYIYVRTALADDSTAAPVENWMLRGIVGIDMFVPVEMEPGRYIFKTGNQELVELNSDSIACLEVGGKYRGITIFMIEQIKSLEECKKMLSGKYEGVPVSKAMKRINGH